MTHEVYILSAVLSIPAALDSLLVPCSALGPQSQTLQVYPFRSCFWLGPHSRLRRQKLCSSSRQTVYGIT